MLGLFQQTFTCESVGTELGCNSVPTNLGRRTVARYLSGKSVSTEKDRVVGARTIKHLARPGLGSALARLY